MSKEKKNPTGQGKPPVSNVFHHENLLEEQQAHLSFFANIFHQDPHDRSPKGRYRYIYPVVLGYCVLMAALALVLDGPKVWVGLKTICLSPDVLITDYVALAGLGAALMNSALVTLAALAVLWLTKAPLGGSTCSTLGLVAGFALFGKDILNIWPIVIGALLYARFRREPLWKYASTGLMATTLAPIVSALWFSEGLGWIGWVAGTLVGLFIGFLVPLLAAYTFLIQRGMNLYNVGFACGLTAMMVVPVMVAADVAPQTVLIWATGYNGFFSALIGALCLLALAAGIILSGGVKKAFQGYLGLLDRSGVPSDFLTACGAGPVLINMALTGLVTMGYVLLIGGDLNGPTVGAILTVVGFAANGKHLGNILPIMAGAALGGLVLPGFELTTPAIQFSALFCTTLAPFAGTFGVPAGVLAGFLHICLVQRTGWAVCGLNLYNNGFTGGVVSIVLYPLVVFLRLHHPAGKQEEDAEELSHLPHHHWLR